MQESTRMSIMSLTGGNSARDTMHSYASDESTRPMLQQHAVAKSSGLRYYIAEDGVVANEDESL